MESSGLPILLIDNYDSYTFNLFHLLHEANNGTPAIVLKNDQIHIPPSELRNHFAAIVISPGPGHPSCEKVLIFTIKSPLTPHLGLLDEF